MRRFALAALLALFALPTPASTGDRLVEQVVLDAAHAGRIAETANNMRTITAYYVERDAGGCSLVSARSSMEHSLKHYRVCGESVEQRHDVEPAPPSDDPRYRQLVVSTGQRALNEGWARAVFGGYAIRAEREWTPRATKCGLVKIIISYEGMIVATEQPKVCQ